MCGGAAARVSDAMIQRLTRDLRSRLCAGRFLSYLDPMACQNRSIHVTDSSWNLRITYLLVLLDDGMDLGASTSPADLQSLQITPIWNEYDQLPSRQLDLGHRAYSLLSWIADVLVCLE